MLKSLSVRVDTMVIPVAERCAKESGLSLDEWINQALWEAAGEPRPGFGTRWRGAFAIDEEQLTDKDIDLIRWQYLSEKYLR